jgi:hypothetical protein
MFCRMQYNTWNVLPSEVHSDPVGSFKLSRFPVPICRVIFFFVVYSILTLTRFNPSPECSVPTNVAGQERVLDILILADY